VNLASREQKRASPWKTFYIISSSFLPANWYFDRGQCWKESNTCGWSNQNIL